MPPPQGGAPAAHAALWQPGGEPVPQQPPGMGQQDLCRARRSAVQPPSQPLSPPALSPCRRAEAWAAADGALPHHRAGEACAAARELVVPPPAAPGSRGAPHKPRRRRSSRSRSRGRSGASTTPWRAPPPSVGAALRRLQALRAGVGGACAAAAVLIVSGGAPRARRCVRRRTTPRRRSPAAGPVERRLPASAAGPAAAARADPAPAARRVAYQRTPLGSPPPVRRRDEDPHAGASVEEDTATGSEPMACAPAPPPPPAAPLPTPYSSCRSANGMGGPVRSPTPSGTPSAASPSPSPAPDRVAPPRLPEQGSPPPRRPPSPVRLSALPPEAAEALGGLWQHGQPALWWAGIVEQRTRHNQQQPRLRACAVSDDAFHLGTLSGGCTRCLPISDVDEVVESADGSGWVGFVCRSGYDMLIRPAPDPPGRGDCSAARPHAAAPGVGPPDLDAAAGQLCDAALLHASPPPLRRRGAPLQRPLRLLPPPNYQAPATLPVRLLYHADGHQRSRGREGGPGEEPGAVRAAAALAALCEAFDDAPRRPPTSSCDEELSGGPTSAGGPPRAPSPGATPQQLSGRRFPHPPTPAPAPATAPTTPPAAPAPPPPPAPDTDPPQCSPERSAPSLDAPAPLLYPAQLAPPRRPPAAQHSDPGCPSPPSAHSVSPTSVSSGARILPPAAGDGPPQLRRRSMPEPRARPAGGSSSGSNTPPPPSGASPSEQRQPTRDAGEESPAPAQPPLVPWEDVPDALRPAVQALYALGQPEVVWLAAAEHGDTPGEALLLLLTLGALYVGALDSGVLTRCITVDSIARSACCPCGSADSFFALHVAGGEPALLVRLASPAADELSDCLAALTGVHPQRVPPLQRRGPAAEALAAQLGLQLAPAPGWEPPQPVGIRVRSPSAEPAPAPLSPRSVSLPEEDLPLLSAEELPGDLRGALGPLFASGSPLVLWAGHAKRHDNSPDLVFVVGAEALYLGPAEPPGKVSRCVHLDDLTEIVLLEDGWVGLISADGVDALLRPRGPGGADRCLSCIRAAADRRRRLAGRGPLPCAAREGCRRAADAARALTLAPPDGWQPRQPLPIRVSPASPSCPSSAPPPPPEAPSTPHSSVGARGCERSSTGGEERGRSKSLGTPMQDPLALRPVRSAGGSARRLSLPTLGSTPLPAPSAQPSSASLPLLSQQTEGSSSGSSSARSDTCARQRADVSPSPPPPPEAPQSQQGQRSTSAGNSSAVSPRWSEGEEVQRERISFAVLPGATAAVSETDEATGLPYVRPDSLSGTARCALAPLFANGQPAVLWAGVVRKQGRKLTRRTLVVTPAAVYLGRDTTVVRYVPAEEVTEILSDEDGWVALRVPAQYDLLVQMLPPAAKQQATFVSVLKSVHAAATEDSDSTPPLLVVAAQGGIDPGSLQLSKPEGSWEPPQPKPIPMAAAVARSASGSGEQLRAVG